MSKRLAVRLGIPALGVAVTLAGATTLRVAGYAPAKERPSEHKPQPAPLTTVGDVRVGLGTVIPGYLSPLGLPPVPGNLSVTDSGLMFNSARSTSSIQLLGPALSTVSLGYVDDHNGTPVYVFRVDAGVFQTEAPGPLLDLAADPSWLDSVASGERLGALRFMEEADSAALWRTAQEIAASPYADSLYALFGRPTAPVGLIGPRGRAAGRLGEYIASRDSLAIDPGRMSGGAQLRHAVAHELGHRWQARAPAQLEMLWQGVPPIRDPKRYGHADVPEHQAEAVAFAVSFLQTTASASEPAASSLTLLDYYELLVPGTRALVRYLSLQPVYSNHPLRTALTGDQPTHSGE